MKNNVYLGEKKGPKFHFPTHVYLGGKKKERKKKKNTSNTRSFGRGEKAGKRNFQHTCLFGREKNKKEIETLSNWQG